jgi:hypothetical protein
MESTPRRYRYSVAARSLEGLLLLDLSILSGDSVGPSDCSVHSVLETAIVNAEVLLSQLRQAKAGNVADSPTVYPSPSEAMEVIDV